MTDVRKLVRRAPTRPLFWLGERNEPLVAPMLGARFPAYPVKERDLVIDLPTQRT